MFKLSQPLSWFTLKFKTGPGINTKLLINKVSEHKLLVDINETSKYPDLL